MGANWRLLALMLTIAVARSAVSTAASPTPDPRPDPVEVARSEDHPTKCDSIGWSVLPDELAQNTVDIPRQGVCLYGDVQAFLLGACIEPFESGDVSDPSGPKPGEEQVICSVLIQNLGDADLALDPGDFMIGNKEATLFPLDTSVQANFPAGFGLSKSAVAPNGYASGKLAFTVDSPLSRPFLIIWKPALFPDQTPAVIVVDRLVPWSDAGRI